MNETAHEITEVRAAQAAPLALAPTSSDSQALMQMIGTAMAQPDFDIVKLERLLAVKREWEADEARRAYNRAFAAFKAEAITIIKNKAVAAGPLKGGKYAELFAVVNAVTPALSRHGLSASWALTKDEPDWIEVTCTLKHEAGHSEAVSMGGPPDAGGAKNAIQARASAKTYLERYTLKAILGVAEQGEDTDGAPTVGAAINHLLDSLLARLETTTTDEQAVAVWKEGAKALSDLKDKDAYAEFKDVVLKHRAMLKNGGAK